MDGEENQDNELVAKQTILQQEIIEKNYDKTAFINFCLSKKENGDDLNNWTLEEIKQIVSEFIASQTNQNPTTEAPKEGENKNEVNQGDVEKMEKVNMDEHKSKEIKIACRKLEKSKLNDQKIVVKVHSPKEIEGSVFSNNYILYEIQTDPVGWTVQRRYSDFDNLRKLIIKFFPSFYVPPLPNKKMGNKRFTEKFIIKRMKFLNLFINSLVENESFKASDILVTFLSYSDRPKFDSKFKEFQTQSPSTYIEEYKTIDGIVTISHDEGNEKYFKNINKYFRLQGQILDKLNYNFKLFYDNMNIMAENLKDISKGFEIMHILNTRVLMKQTITKSYEELGCFFKNWQKIILNQNVMVKNHMKDFFKFINLEGQAYTELIDRREELKAKYVAESTRVTNKKEKVFATGDINKFEIAINDTQCDRERVLKDKPYAFEHICANDTKNLEKLYYQLGYTNKMNMQELKKMIKGYCVRYIENIKQFDVEFYPSINDLVGTWSNMETFLMTIQAQQK
jgi:sorting nexin-7/30/sorting nexin-8